MYAAPFDYVRASSWNDAVTALRDAGEDAHVIAGGQSLVPMMMLRIARPSVLVDIGAAGERTIERRDGTLVLSALTRHIDLERSEAVRDAAPMLAEAARLIGNVRVRHRGTIGGSLAHAEATAELPCVAVALGATVQALGPSGERAIPVGELFVTHLTTALQPGEIITRVELPVLRRGQGSCFVELVRRAGDFSMLNVAALVTVSDNGRCEDARLVLGATSHKPVDVSPAVQGLRSEEASAELVGEIARRVAEEAEVRPNLHAGEAYRREMVAVLVKRALLKAAARARTAGAGGHTDGGPGG